MPADAAQAPAPPRPAAAQPAPHALSPAAPCAVCQSPLVVYVRDVPTRRTSRNIPLYHCLACRSFTNPSGYREDDAQLRRDLQWNLAVKDRNTRWSAALLKELRQRLQSPRSALEIGCGTGTFLELARRRQWRTLGFDLNPHAVAHGREHDGLDLRCERWDRHTVRDPYDVVLCISVFEHLEHPRELAAELAAYCAAHGASLFASAPYLDPDRYAYLLDPDPTREGTPFFDNDVHVTHFAKPAFQALFQSLGAKRCDNLLVGGWDGFLFRF